jgi:hypothetical protein
MVGAPPPFPTSGKQKSPDETTATSSPDQSQTAGLNKRCSNRRLRDELQVALRYPRFNIGLPNALTTR